jgi:hypothetical protein
MTVDKGIAFPDALAELIRTLKRSREHNTVAATLCTGGKLNAILAKKLHQKNEHLTGKKSLDCHYWSRNAINGIQ